MSHPIVYRWSDGSFAELSPIVEFNKAARLRLVFYGDLSFMILLDSERAAFSSSPSLTGMLRVRGVPREEVIEKYHQIRRKICGLLLDLGVCPNNAGVLLRGSSADVRLPFFVSEDLWSRRFELAKDQSIGGNSFEAVPNYMEIGSIYRLQIRYDEWDMNWKIYWMSGRSGGEVSARKYVSDTFENAVGTVMRENNIRSESDRASWEAENAERGVFLIPTPEEVEVFRILDEPLPFFLPGEEVIQWVASRAP